MTTSTVITAEAMTAPMSPKAEMRAAVAIAEAVMLAMLLPTSSAPISRSRFLVRASTSEARQLPRRSSSVSLARDVAVRAVSAPEKNADAIKSASTMTTGKAIS